MLIYELACFHDHGKLQCFGSLTSLNILLTCGGGVGLHAAVGRVCKDRGSTPP
jgi:hypothetical protein